MKRGEGGPLPFLAGRGEGGSLPFLAGRGSAVSQSVGDPCMLILTGCSCVFLLHPIARVPFASVMMWRVPGPAHSTHSTAGATAAGTPPDMWSSPVAQAAVAAGKEMSIAWRKARIARPSTVRRDGCVL